MTKVIEVESCEDCPHYNCVIQTCDELADENRMPMKVEDEEEVPDWCPLPSPDKYLVMSLENEEDKIHAEIRAWINENNFPQKSLDELMTQVTMTAEQEKEALALLDKLDSLST